MPDRESSPPAGPGRAEQALVAAMAGAAVVGFAAVHGARTALASLAVMAVSLAWRPARLPRWVLRTAPGVLRVALGSVFLMRAGLTLYPVLDDERVALVALVAGSLLVPLLTAAVLGTRVWKPALAAVPLSIALVAVASFDPSPGVRWVQVTEALLCLAYLIVALPRVESPVRPRAPWMRAATAYMPKVGGQRITLSTPARQNARTTRSMDSSLPRPGRRFSAGTP